MSPIITRGVYLPKKSKFKTLSEDLNGLKVEIGRLNTELEAAKGLSGRLAQVTFGSPDLWLSENRGAHNGEKCYLLGCGPSLTNVDLSQLSDGAIAGVNGVAEIPDLDLDYFFSVSRNFHVNHTDSINSVRAKRRFLADYLEPHLNNSLVPTSWLRPVDQETFTYPAELHPYGFSTEPERHVFFGGTVLFPALQVLAHLGFSTIVLLGVDHNYGLEKNPLPGGVWVSGEQIAGFNFLGDYWKADDRVHLDMRAMQRGFELAREHFQSRGKTLVNATDSTKLDAIAKITLEEALQLPSSDGTRR